MALMGSEEPTFLSLASHCLDARQQVNAMENEALVISFTMKELEEVLKATKNVTPPGTDGFRVAFLNKFKPIIETCSYRSLIALPWAQWMSLASIMVQ
jgi:hypothetical protein